MNNNLNFLNSPLEIRSLIYESLFKSTTVIRGFGRRRSTNTALLRTCKQIHNEAIQFLAPNIFLHFKATINMLDDLYTYDEQRIQSIRRLRVKGYPLAVYDDPEDSEFASYYFCGVLPMFPGLQLDLLVVESCFMPTNDNFGNEGTYCDIDNLVTSDGWKELHYITASPRFFNGPFSNANKRFRSLSQPASWQSDLQNRDRDDHASVEVYIANEPGVLAVYHPDACSKHYSIPGCLKSPEHSQLMEYLNAVRETLVVMKRGPSASYVQGKGCLVKDIAKLLSDMSWRELRDDGFIDGESYMLL